MFVLNHEPPRRTPRPTPQMTTFTSELTHVHTDPCTSLFFFSVAASYMRHTLLDRLECHASSHSIPLSIAPHPPQMSDSVSGQTVVDPKGYLTDLNSIKACPLRPDSRFATAFVFDE